MHSQRRTRYLEGQTTIAPGNGSLAACMAQPPLCDVSDLPALYVPGMELTAEVCRPPIFGPSSPGLKKREDLEKGVVWGFVTAGRTICPPGCCAGGACRRASTFDIHHQASHFPLPLHLCPPLLPRFRSSLMASGWSGRRRSGAPRPASRAAAVAQRT